MNDHERLTEPLTPFEEFLPIGAVHIAVDEVFAGKLCKFLCAYQTLPLSNAISVVREHAMGTRSHILLLMCLHSSIWAVCCRLLSPTGPLFNGIIIIGCIMVLLTTLTVAWVPPVVTDRHNEMKMRTFGAFCNVRSGYNVHCVCVGEWVSGWVGGWVREGGMERIHVLRLLYISSSIKAVSV